MASINPRKETEIKVITLGGFIKRMWYFLKKEIKKHNLKYIYLACRLIMV
jgi:hypothetical protein